LSKPSLHEVLQKHRKPMEEKKPKEKHIVITARDARTLFFDLPKEHKFWLKSGREINNLSELYKSLVEMDEDIFKHHVTKHKDDFAKWVGDILHDTILARRLKASRTKLGHVEAVKNRIDELRGKSTRIPTPHSRLQANYGFLKTDRKPAAFPPDPHGFRLKGAPLQPDSTFINVQRRADDDPHFNELVGTQLDMLETVKRDVDDQELILKDVEVLRRDYDNLFGEFNAIRNELSGIKASLQTDAQEKRKQDQQNIESMQETVKSLREKERDILGELKFISKTEQKIVNKNEALMAKEAELEKKESVVLSKEQHYQKLMTKYDQMLRSIKTSMHEDEKKIQKLLHGVVTHPAPAQYSEKHRRGDMLSNKAKSEIKQQIDKALGDSHLLEQMEITDILKETETLLKHKEYEKVSENLEHVKGLLKSKDLDNDFKKQSYYQVFELATELDLRRK